MQYYENSVSIYLNSFKSAILRGINLCSALKLMSSFVDLSILKILYVNIIKKLMHSTAEYTWQNIKVPTTYGLTPPPLLYGLIIVPTEFQIYCINRKSVRRGGGDIF